MCISTQKKQHWSDAAAATAAVIAAVDDGREKQQLNRLKVVDTKNSHYTQRGKKQRKTCMASGGKKPASTYIKFNAMQGNTCNSNNHVHLSSSPLFLSLSLPLRSLVFFQFKLDVRLKNRLCAVTQYESNTSKQYTRLCLLPGGFRELFYV